MKKSYYNPTTHIGEQPVRVLKHNITQQWQSLDPEFKDELFAILKQHNLQPVLHYECEEGPILSPSKQLIPFVSGEKQITIQESFLSFVWALSYCHLVFFEELNNKVLLKKMHGQNHPIATDAVLGAQRLFNYACGLVNEYSKWDKDQLPNPEFYDSADIYVEKTNGVFVLAIVFILCHELAHIKCGHLDDYIPSADLPLAENEADLWAIEIMLKGATDATKQINRGAGMILGYCALLSLERSLSSETHPHLAERIELVLRKLNLSDISPLWGIACVSFRMWDQHHNKANQRIKWPDEADSFKELFYLIFEQAKTF